MSDSTASLRHQINSAGDLKSVVRAMKALAASSIGQYQRSVIALEDYHRSVELGLGACLRAGPTGALKQERQGASSRRPIGAIVFGSDQGLVGQFNESVADYAIEALGVTPSASDPTPPPSQVWAIGTRAGTRLTERGLAPRAVFNMPTSVHGITPLAGQVLVEAEASQDRGEIGALHLFYNRSTPGAGYAPCRTPLLPLDEAWRARLLKQPWPTKKLPQVMGHDTTTLQALIGEYLFVSLFRAFAESLASENASRLAAMQRADKNIDDLLETLNGTFHRLRQDGIDEELFDVVSGFEALRKT